MTTHKHSQKGEQNPGGNQNQKGSLCVLNARSLTPFCAYFRLYILHLLPLLHPFLLIYLLLRILFLAPLLNMNLSICLHIYAPIVLSFSSCPSKPTRLPPSRGYKTRFWVPLDSPPPGRGARSKKHRHRVTDPFSLDPFFVAPTPQHRISSSRVQWYSGGLSPPHLIPQGGNQGGLSLIHI